MRRGVEIPGSREYGCGHSLNGDRSRQALPASAMDAVIRIAIVLLLAAWCFEIVKPFITSFVWGVIIAIAAYPLYDKLCAALAGRRGLAAGVMVLVGLLVLIVPSVMLSGTLVEGALQLADALRDGALEVPPPPDSVRTWPLIGEPIADFWALASENLENALRQIRDQLKSISLWLLKAVAGVGFGILQFVFAIVIAGVLLAHSRSGYRVSHSIAARLSGVRGERYAELAQATVRSVARGILGVAIIQSLLSGLGFLAVGVPGAGLWALLCLFLGIIQIGPTLILVPVVVYVFSTASTTVAVVYLIWSLFVGVIDNVLKPVLLGRGVDVPMIVIFVGAIGGFLSMGIIGLFVGSIVLVLGHTLLITWLNDAEPLSAPGAPGHD
jgi:predicted PurR-regulated permease PerM